jgi:hypothetical protein
LRKFIIIMIISIKILITKLQIKFSTIIINLVFIFKFLYIIEHIICIITILLQKINKNNLFIEKMSLNIYKVQETFFHLV